MTSLLLVPVVMSFLVLGAHFLRTGSMLLVLGCLVPIGLLVVRRRWAAWVAQAGLLVGTIEWARALVQLAGERVREGAPYGRLVAILGGVAVFTALSSLVFFTKRLRDRYAAPKE